MALKERFEGIIVAIEERVIDSEQCKPAAVVESVCQECLCNIRELSVIFKFLTEMSLLDYVRERKMMAAYSLLMDQMEFDVEAAIEVSGYDNQSSFGKKFKETFGVSPKEAFESKNQNLYKQPLSWEQASSATVLPSSNSMETNEMRFGVKHSQFTKIMEAADYQALYGFDDALAEFAFELAEREKVSIKDAFMFVDDYLHWCIRSVDKNTINQTIEFLSSVKAKEIKRLYFQVTQSVAGALEIIEDAEKCGCKTAQIASEYLRVYYKETRITFEELLYQIERFEDLDGLDFEEYISMLLWGCSEEDAAKGWGDDLLDDYDAPEEFNESFEQWAQEETDYYNCDDQATDYDEENLYYEDEDV